MEAFSLEDKKDADLDATGRGEAGRGREAAAVRWNATDAISIGEKGARKKCRTRA